MKHLKHPKLKKNHTFKSIIGYFPKLLLKMACVIFENRIFKNLIA